MLGIKNEPKSSEQGSMDRRFKNFISLVRGRPGPRFENFLGPWSALVRFFQNFAGPRPVRSADRTGSLGPRGPTFRSVDPWVGLRTESEIIQNFRN